MYFCSDSVIDTKFLLLYQSTVIATHDVECYDIVKNEWITISEKTVGEHRMYPIIWTENNNIIHIASTRCKLFEKMDLRENKWIVYVGNDDKSFDNIFGTVIEKNKQHRLCL